VRSILKSPTEHHVQGAHDGGERLADRGGRHGGRDGALWLPVLGVALALVILTVVRGVEHKP